MSKSNDMADLRSSVIETVDRYAVELNNLSQQIWKNPELGFKEYSAHTVLTDFLEKAGFKVEKHYKIETAFKATFGDVDPSKPHIAVICEYDALPGIGHACGHNLIAEVGIAAGLGIKDILEKSDTKLGQLTVLGTPAEEGGGGKIILMKHGAFKTFDVAMMAHPTPATVTKIPILARSKLMIKYIGKASHAAGFPWDGINALDAAVLCYQNISCLRQQFKPTWRVHGVITNGGVKPNIIPDQTELEYSVRAPKDSELKILEAKIVKCIESAAQATGCKVEYEFGEHPYSAMLYNNTLCELYEKNASSVGVEFSMDESIKQSPLGSTDMGNVSTVVPSIHPCFHMGTLAANHTTDFTTAAGSPAAQTFTLQQGKALALTALDIYQSTDLLQKIKQDFITDTQNA
ncbi:xaa-Arg dipeptidase isoform X2 [Patella vulgata]|nr:xaa-Arg dipeptidase isoform X2 [Patella vulgata]XP_050390618.2 xaa-Arg dipeptidase isoform X2 [Patella vulgata]XP_050390619.2 xaa-Arg dipeptidase isoform X2 [Patella vulgata]